MPYSKCPNGTAGGRFTGYAASWWHNSFNLHYFRPYFLWQISFLQFRPNLRFRFLSSNSPSFSLQRRKSPQTRPQGQFNNQQSHFNKCCNSRKEKDTLICERPPAKRRKAVGLIKRNKAMVVRRIAL